MRMKFGLRHLAGLTTFVACMAAALFIVPAAFASGNAGYTTFDELLGGCLNGSPNGINCNNYDAKEHVFMNGGPTGGNGLADGAYYFAVLTPGSQNGGFLDGATGNLSDTAAGGTAGDLGSGDDLSNRTFQVTDGLLSAYGGTHALGTDPQGNAVIGLAPFDDTDNPGGVYILAICTVGASSPSDCKYDAFKVQPATPCTEDCNTGIAADPTISKDAAGSYDTTYTWGITKGACVHGITPCSQTVDALGSSVTFDYTVKVTNDGGTNSGIKVSGNISVTNPNDADVTIDAVTDTLSTNQDCVVTNGGSQTIAASSSTPEPPDAGAITYECDISGTAVPTDLFNTASVSWSGQVLTNGDALVGNTANFTFPTDPNGSGIDFTQTKIGDCIAVTDAFNGGSPGALGTFCADGTDSGVATTPAVTASYTAPTWTLTYSRTVSVVANSCRTYGNSATFSGASVTSELKGTDTASVRVCGPATGGLTMGFWQNKNGQGIISGANQASLGSWLRGYHPFSNAPSTNLAGYVTTIIKAASCTSSTKTCNTMLRAQMLATALDVYFSDASLGGDQIAKYNGNNTTNLGSLSIDLTKICAMIDGSGGSTCTGTYENVSSAFGGATSLTVLAMLAYQNTSDPAADAGANWYGQTKATQILAKDAFDAFNNQVAFIAP